MKPSYSIVIGTLNRSPQKNYLGDTLTSLRKSGLWESPIPFRLDIVDSGSKDEDNYFKEQVYSNVPSPLSSHQLTVHRLDQAELKKPRPQWVSEKEGWFRRSRNANAVACLKVGIASGAPWVLFIEDDVEVCKDFLGSVDRWLHDHARRDRHLYSFCTPYKDVAKATMAGQQTWDFPIQAFYGNQALAFMRADAMLAASWIESRMQTWDTGQGFDLLLKEWAKARWPGVHHFLSSAPSLVQHVGQESSIHLGRFHQASGFCGTEWSYRSAVAR
jgi:glycosyltransferase involved in cell wall biosynthesis